MRLDTRASQHFKFWDSVVQFSSWLFNMFQFFCKICRTGVTAIYLFLASLVYLYSVCSLLTSLGKLELIGFLCQNCIPPSRLTSLICLSEFGFCRRHIELAEDPETFLSPCSYCMDKSREGLWWSTCKLSVVFLKLCYCSATPFICRCNSSMGVSSCPYWSK